MSPALTKNEYVVMIGKKAEKEEKVSTTGRIRGPGFPRHHFEHSWYMHGKVWGVSQPLCALLSS